MLKDLPESDAEELSMWRSLRDPHTLHANLLRGQPARLSHEQLAHLIGYRSDAQTATAEAAFGRAGLMATCAVRYCLGRMSYVVSDCVSWLRFAWPHLPECARTIIARDIEDKIEDDNMSRQTSNRHHPLGMDMDREAWLSLRDLWGK